MVGTKWRRRSADFLTLRKVRMAQRSEIPWNGPIQLSLGAARMIHEVEGDILKTAAAAIAHGVAANDPMNQGLAAALHQLYPAMHKDFHHWCRQHHPKLGSAWIWSGAGGARVINLITQDGGYEHGSKPQKASTSSVNHALRALRKIVADEGLVSVALPRLATGVGGLDWSVVKPLIHQQLGDVDANVYVYQLYVPDQKATEPAG
jgi:O-acetyl-ADP-ribose deacetylase (regulator of RNase III)